MCELLKASELDDSRTKSSSGCSWKSNLAALRGEAIRHSKAVYLPKHHIVSAMHAPCLDKILVCKHSPKALIKQKISS